MTDFQSVNTSAARVQELSLNPEKLTGMCAKLKCCLNYEVDVYYEALKDFPSKNKKLETKEGIFRHIKNDALKGMMTYILNKRDGVPVFATISTARAKEIIALNNEGEVPDSLVEFVEIKVDKSPTYENVVGQDDLTRFDKTVSKNKKRRNKKRRPKDGTGTGNNPAGEKKQGGAAKNTDKPKGNRPRNNRSKNKSPKAERTNENQGKSDQPKGGNRPPRVNKPKKNKPSADKE